MERKNDVLKKIPKWKSYKQVKERWGISSLALTKLITESHLPAYYPEYSKPIHKLIEEEPYNRGFYLQEEKIYKLGIKLSDIEYF